MVEPAVIIQRRPYALLAAIVQLIASLLSHPATGTAAQVQSDLVYEVVSNGGRGGTDCYSRPYAGTYKFCACTDCGATKVSKCIEFNPRINLAKLVTNKLLVQGRKQFAELSCGDSRVHNYERCDGIWDERDSAAKQSRVAEVSSNMNEIDDHRIILAVVSERQAPRGDSVRLEITNLAEYDKWFLSGYFAGAVTSSVPISASVNRHRLRHESIYARPPRH